MTKLFKTTLAGAAIGAIGLLASAVFVPAFADDAKVLVKVDGKDITLADVKLAEAEIGTDISSIPEGDRLRAIVEYLIDNNVLAAAAEKENMGSGPAFDARVAYYKKRALRDAYTEAKVKNGVAEADAKKVYDDQVAKIPAQEEIHARHILVEKEDEAKAIVDRLGKGEKFEDIAKTASKDPGSGANGGDLGFFSRGQMVKPFEEAAFTLKPGEVSKPVQSQFGWHIIRLEEKRNRPLPTFDSVKERILSSLTQKKSQEVMALLRGAAKIDVVDEDLKKKMAKGVADPAAAGTAAEGATGQ